MQFTTLNVLALAASATAATFKVAVGENGLTYSPNDIKANVGDSVEFSFFPANHTVTQSSFSDPCHPLAGGFFSGFVPTKISPSGTTFTITVENSKPIWFYCGQTKGNHCQSGMLGAINAPATGNTLAAFTQLAKNATTSTSPPSGPVGGVLNVGSNSSGSGNGSNSTASLSVHTSSYTTSYSTTAVLTSEVASVYTSGGVAYTTSYESTFTTAYGTTVATASVVTSTGSAAGSTPTGQNSGAGSVTASMAVLGAAVLSAMVLA
ncbi:uncharacterized protein BP5553_07588 [Venustampulla echinocandica]|uniref:Cupredoxin n=1 Tax=Venustampulla echinocandica TaxID=2656787 RepID=A0A370TH17_9HELO|nr:uncharacterized protein BP5553_07588 [Venustampulla echinocandica]RDL34460.1 hypothetical protein BP5553_07588 [Venustampulla echinocandica]